MSDVKDITVEDPYLCLDDYFPNCGGSKTHGMLLSQIFSISWVNKEMKAVRERTFDEIIAELPKSGIGMITFAELRNALYSLKKK